jgi:hypothetical protein
MAKGQDFDLARLGTIVNQLRLLLPNKALKPSRIR